MTDIEIWRTCALDHRYDVSSHGRVRHARKGNIIKDAPNRYGYLDLEIGGKPFETHVLIAATFIGPCPAGKEVDHKDNNKLNNRADNFQYLTPAENKAKYQAYRRSLKETQQAGLVLSSTRRRIVRQPVKPITAKPQIHLPRQSRRYALMRA